jgi:hypothetical protein
MADSFAVYILGSIAVFVGKKDGGRSRSVEKSKCGTSPPLSWKSRKSVGIPTSPTARAATGSILNSRFKKK